MKHCKHLLLACLVAVVLTMTAFAQSPPTETIEVPNDLDADILSTVLTMMSDGTFAETTETTDIPEGLDGEILSTFLSLMGSDAEETPDLPFTPDGNLTLVDDMEKEDKQFITVQSKNGNFFYLVIDRSGDAENVYFLNLVDEADLMALMESEPTEDGQCICTEPCIGGTVNHDCPVCDVDTAGCQAEIRESDTSEPEEVEPEQPEVLEKPVEETEENPSPLPMVITVVAILGIGTLCYFKFSRKKPQPTISFDDDEDEDYEVPEETESSEDDLL